nr:NADH-quinone oxidoreductase subunit C [Streptomyces alkaliterrae]
MPAPAPQVFGPGARAAEAYDLLTVDVPAERWKHALTTARDELGCSYFDWLSAVDEPGTGFLVSAHVVALPTTGGVAPRRLLLRTTVPHDAAELPTVTDVYAGAAWHERETHEMFGVAFTGHPHLTPLLLPDGFEGHPLRKDFVLAARVAKAWPGAKEPGEGPDHGPKRRQMLPPGVPDPNEWGPLKGQLPPAPARPARGRAAAGERPARRTRTAAAGSASQAGAAGAGAAAGERPARRARSVGEGSASQRTTGAAETAGSAADSSATGPSAGGPAAAGPRRSRSASEGSASQRAAEPTPAPEEPATGGPATGGPAPDGPATGPAKRTAPPRRASSDAPWHQPRPAHDEPATPPGPATAADRPAESADRPATGGHRAANDADRPVESTDGPAGGTGRPAEGAGRPADDARRPAEGADRPVGDGDAGDAGASASERRPDAEASEADRSEGED